MALSTIIKSRGSLSAPDPSTPYVPDYTSGLLIDINPAEWGFGDGAVLTSLPASGLGSERLRDFSYKSYAEFEFPTYSQNGGAGGAPSIHFNGNSQIGNGQPNNLPETLVQPLTYAMIVKLNALPVSGVTDWQRICLSATSTVTSGFQTIQPTSNGTGYSFTSSIDAAAEYVTTPFPPGKALDHLIFIVAFNGANCRVKPFSGPVQNFSQELGPLRGLSLGSTLTQGGPTVTGKMLKAEITRFQLFGRALTAADMTGLDALWREQYGL